MQIYQLGYNWRHPVGFAIERPNGHFGVQLILVRSKGHLKMGNTEYHVDRNTAFIVESCLPHCIYADGEEYADDWIRFSTEPDDAEFINGLNLDLNVPIKLEDESVSMLIAACEEVFKSDLTRKKDTMHCILKAILIHISEHSRPAQTYKTGYYDSLLDKLKKDIYNGPARDWNIPGIAEKLSISVSHFQRLYKKRFGISCTNDIFISRMQYAKWLLLNTDSSAKEIAFMCGYQNYEYFSRSFTKYACVSPVQYRTVHKEK